MTKKILSIVSVGLTLSVFALFLSYQRVTPTPEDSSAIFATGGFPVQAFDYPFPALGDNTIPARILLLFGLDILFWLMIVIALYLFVPQIKTICTKYSFLIIPLGMLSVILGYLYLMIRFD